jgi:nucleoside-diphosphate-sugar epimerase
MILVTGSTGLVGSHLLYHLILKGEEVLAFKRKTSSTELVRKLFSWYNHQDLFDKINWVEGDVLDYNSLITAMNQVDDVYHTAAMVSFHAADKQKLLQINIEGTANIVNASLEAGIRKLCYVSSVAALGRAGTGKITTEDTEWKNIPGLSIYSHSKHHAEMEVWRGIAEGLQAVIVNPTIILGPGKWDEGSVKMFQTVYKGLLFYTGGRNGYVDVDDLAKAMIRLTEGNFYNERFLISSENIWYKDLFTWMAESLQVKPPRKKAGPVLSELSWRALKLISFFTGKPPLITKETAQTANQDFQYSNEKFIRATGMKFKPVKQTIEETAKIFLKDYTKQ